MSCPKKPWWQSWKTYCSNYPHCPSCTGTKGSSVGGVFTGSGGPRYYRRLRENEWVDLTSTEQEQIEKGLVEAGINLRPNSVEQNLALARFADEQDLILLRVYALDDAFSNTPNQPNPHIGMELAAALQDAGFFEAALQTLDYMPEILTSTDCESLQILGTAMLSRGRILESLGRVGEADAAFANARHMFVSAGELTK